MTEPKPEARIAYALEDVASGLKDIAHAIDLLGGAQPPDGHTEQSEANESDVVTASEAQADAQAEPTDEVIGRLKAAAEGHGLTFDHLGYVSDTGELAFKYGFYDGDFDLVKQVTSECDYVGYNGDYNTLDRNRLGEYIARLDGVFG